MYDLELRLLDIFSRLFELPVIEKYILLCF